MEGAVDQSLVLVHLNNYQVYLEYDPRNEKRTETLPEKLIHFCVFGCCIANVAEDTCSLLVDTHHETLQTLVYCPGAFKGGIFIRPKYHEGDRCGKQTFPRLTHIVCHVLPSEWPLPAMFGWDTPALETLCFRCDEASDAANAAATAQQAFEAYPALERVCFIEHDMNSDYVDLRAVEPFITINRTP